MFFVPRQFCPLNLIHIIQIRKCVCWQVLKMAERALQRLEDQLNCSICLDTYTNPRVLHCLHVYCQCCLEKLLLKNKGGQFTLTCPNCRHVTPVPASGVAGLPAAFQINQLLEIVEEHKRAKGQDGSANGGSPASPGGGEGMERDSTGPAPQKVFCPAHEGTKMELYCETCEKLICWKCVIKGGEHHNHEFEEISNAFEKCKAEIMSSLEPMEKQLGVIDKALEEFDAGGLAISKQQGAIVVDIHSTMTQLHEVLDRRETELYTQLNSISQTKLKGLEAQKDQIETTRAQLSSCLHFMRENIETGSQAELLLAKKKMATQVTELTTALQADTLEPSTKPDIVFSAPADLTSECERYGQVSTECYATGTGLEAAQVGEKSQVVVYSLDKAIKCELVSEITGATAKGNVESNGHNQYEISYQPTVKGRHQLHIKVDAQHIKGSPFCVIAGSPVEKLGAPILTVSEFQGPEGVVVINGRREVVVTDWREHCISVFSTSGKKLRSFGAYGCGQGQFQYPCGVTVDGDGNVLVVDSGNHRIQKFTIDGDFLAAVGTEGCWPLQFDRPAGIAYSEQHRKLYVTDKANHQVQILNTDLTHFSTFGRRGSGEGQFNYPMHVACDTNGNVYVADRGNHRVQVFTAEGEFLRMFGSHGSEATTASNASSPSASPSAPSMGSPSAGSPGLSSPSGVSGGASGREGRESEGLDSPYGVTVDSSGLVYVSEWGIHRVSVFTAGGQFVTSIGKWGRVLSWRQYMSSFGRGKEPVGELKEPCGLAVDSTGVLYVCDHGNKCVHML